MTISKGQGDPSQLYVSEKKNFKCLLKGQN